MGRRLVNGRALRHPLLEGSEHDERQAFEIVEAADMTNEEHHAITEHWRKKISALSV